MFLGWAWVVSMDSLRGAGVQTSSRWLALAQFEGEVCIASSRDITLWDRRVATTVIHAYGTGGSPEYGVWWDAFTRYGWVVPHWLLLLFVLVPWGAWLVWHWRREQRKLAG